MIKRVKLVELNTKIATAFWSTQTLKMINRIQMFNKNYIRKLHGNLKKRFFDIYKFSNHDISKFILLLRKGVYPYKYMDH